MYAGRYREAIDPFAYSHRCDLKASYVPKHRPSDVKTWQKVSDTTGRGYCDAKNRHTPGCVCNQRARESMPKPNMDTLLTQNPASLDHKNRFFEDNRKKLNSALVYDHMQEEPQYSDKKNLASKVTSRDFIVMPVPEISPPKGFRETIPAKQRAIRSALKQTAPTQKHRGTKQVSEVDEQDSSKPGKVGKGVRSGNQPATTAQQIEEKMQKTVDLQQESQVNEGGDAHQRQELTVEVVPQTPQPKRQQEPVVVFAQTQAPRAMGATEDQQTTGQVRPTVSKQEEQDETSSVVKEPAVGIDGVGVCDVKQHQHSQQYNQKPCCKQSARRITYQQKDPCQQRSALFRGSLLDAPADDRKRTSYGRFYNSKQSSLQGKAAGTATMRTHLDDEPECQNRCRW